MILQNFKEEPYSKGGILKREPITKNAKELIDKFDIRPRESAKRPAGTLSEKSAKGYSSKGSY